MLTAVLIVAPFASAIAIAGGVVSALGPGWLTLTVTDFVMEPPVFAAVSM